MQYVYHEQKLTSLVANPPASVLQVNHAIGATSSMYHASCVTADAADADLVIVELTLNDYPGPEMDITQSPSKCAPRLPHVAAP